MTDWTTKQDAIYTPELLRAAINRWKQHATYEMRVLTERIERAHPNNPRRMRSERALARLLR